MARDGAKLVVRSDRGVVYSRNVEDAKRAVQDSPDETTPGPTDKQKSDVSNADETLTGHIGDESYILTS